MPSYYTKIVKGDTLYKLFGKDWEEANLDNSTETGHRPEYCDDDIGTNPQPITDADLINLNTHKYIISTEQPWDRVTPDGEGHVWGSPLMDPDPPTTGLSLLQFAHPGIQIYQGDSLYELADFYGSDFDYWKYDFLNGDNGAPGGLDKISPGDYGPHYIRSTSGPGSGGTIYYFDIPQYPPP